MSETHIFEGKTTNEAIEIGLKNLKVSKKDVEIKVLENEDKRSFFSILAPRVVKVEMTIKQELKRETKKERKETQISKNDMKKAENNIKEFLQDFTKKLPTKGISFETKIENEYINVELKGEDINYLIGYRGETLNAIQNILKSVASKELECRVKVIVDIYGYREKREKSLQELAEKLAKTVVRTRKAVKLEPMSAYERKIIHEQLQNNNKVATSSVGEEPYRKVIISLK